jgi:hypothetical protein
MNVEQLTVDVPQKDGFDTETVTIWTRVEDALTRIGAEEITFDAARGALHSSAGCIVLAKYLVQEGLNVKKMDFGFRAPLLARAFLLTAQDDGADCLYDSENGVIICETDDHQFAFDVLKDWKVDWRRLSHEVVDSYEGYEDIDSAWTLDTLLEHADVPVEAYRRTDD